MVEAIRSGASARVGKGLAAFVVCLTGAIRAAGAPGQDASELARRILAEAGVKGGLIVHLGCGDPGAAELTAALRAADCYLVHGLDSEAAKVGRAREQIAARGLYGPVSVDCFDGTHLPYADNMVNLLVAADLGGVSPAEAQRVLAPGGVLYTRQGGAWRKSVKPRPGNTDEWTHFLHDASGNAVAHDAVVGPPRRVQWIAHPRHTRSHEHIPSINAVVSSAGRIFYIADEAPVRSVRRMPQWHLVARDAYNGVLLWKRPFSPWFPHIVNWGRTPHHLQRRLVAVGGRVYVTLGLHAPLSCVDAGTGETIRVYKQTRGTEEVLCHRGVLLLAVRNVTEERTRELEKMMRLTRRAKSPLYDRDTAEPYVTQFRKTEWKGGRAVVAIDAETAALLWRKTGAEAAGLRPESLSAAGGRVLYQKGRDVICVDLKTGRQAWSAPGPPMRVVGGGAIVCAGGERVSALSVKTGKPLWSEQPTLCQIRDAFIVNGSIWLGGFKPWQGRKKGKRGPAWGPYFATRRDLATGKVLKEVEPEGPGHHHRCWRNKATDRYILAGRRGVEFIDLETGDVLWHSWVRGVCRYGVMPCNGLLYAPPHACGCYIAAKLEGFYALAPRAKAPGGHDGPVDERRLEKGPAYAGGSASALAEAKAAAGRSGKTADRASQTGKHAAWPTYRHDAARSGRTPSGVPAALARKWQAKLGGRLSSVTAADGKVFVADVDRHRVCAFDAGTGKAAWQFTAGARVDSPPTIHRGRAIFGSRDGCVYAVRASDGALAWRLRATGGDRRVVAWGQLESAWPVHGSVTLRDGAAYFAAGRSSYLDGGIGLYRVDCQIGEVLSATRLYSPDPKTGRQPKQFGPCYMPGALSDILSSDAECVYLRDAVFDKQCRSKAEGKAHLFTMTGFLDDTWPHRSYWVYGTRCSISTGCSGRDRNLISARLMVFDDAAIYGYGRARLHWSNQLQDGAYRLFALDRGQRRQRWSRRADVRVRAMVLAGKVLFVAGPPAGAGDGPDPAEAGRGAMLLALSASEGAELGRCRLESAPVFDGMAAAGGRLYVALENGRLLCLAGEAGRP